MRALPPPPPSAASTRPVSPTLGFSRPPHQVSPALGFRRSALHNLPHRFTINRSHLSHPIGFTIKCSRGFAMLLTLVPDISQTIPDMSRVVPHTVPHCIHRRAQHHVTLSSHSGSSQCFVWARPESWDVTDDSDSARVKLGAGVHTRHQLKPGSQNYSSGCLYATSGATALA